MIEMVAATIAVAVLGVGPIVIAFSDRPASCWFGIHGWRCGDEFPEIECEYCGAEDIYEPL